jgi:drug/metabolite transporter (DMT)-like permease
MTTEVKNFSQNVPLLILALLAVDGLHFVFARALHDHMHPVSSAVLVLGVGTLEVVAFAAAQKRMGFDTFRRHIVFFLVLGAIVATSTTINYVAVEFIDPGSAALLAQSSILFGLGLGVWWLRERLTWPQLAGAGLAIAGAVVITFHPGDFLRAGALLVVGSSALYAVHAAVVKRYGSGIDFLEFFVWRLAATTGFLILSAAVQGKLALPPSAPAWAWVLAAGTVDVVISRTLYYLSLRQLPVSIHSLLLTLSPVVAILWSLVLFRQLPTAQDLTGGAAVLAGVAIVTYRRS